MQFETFASEPTAPTSDALAPGSALGAYQITGVLGTGGMATVYAAVHSLIGKRAAIKVLRPMLARSPLMIARFVQEARAVNRIGHPNIVDVFGYGTLPDGSPYYVMEQLEGNTVADRARYGAMSLAEVAPIIAGVTRALSAAHAHGVIHRDIKPANIWVTNKDVIKLLDFGVAKLLDRDSAISTDVGVLIGTPHYMSPEQARGAKITTATDVYALGVVLFELLSGARPFESKYAADVLVLHLQEDAPRLADQCDVPANIAALVDAMLLKDPEARPTLADVAAAFTRRPRRWFGTLASALMLGLAVAELAL